MQYTAQVTIQKHIKEVIMLFNNPLHLSHWNADMEYKEILQGKLGEPGCIAKVILKTPLMNVEMEEEMIKKELPSSIIFKYTSNGVSNTIEHEFSKMSQTETQYLLKGFFQFENPMAAMMSPMMAGIFETQAKNLTLAFKKFCEKNFYDSIT